MWKKQTPARANRIEKENWGEPRIFSEIIELKVGKKLPYILCILALFLGIMVAFNCL